MKPTPTEIYLQWLSHDAGWVEICQMDKAPREIGWDNRSDVVLAQAREWARSGNLFTTLNRIDHPGLLAYLAQERQVDPHRKLRTTDALVTRYTRLFFDFDPARPKGTSSTDAELAEAEIRAKGLRDRLALMDWPAPLMAMSGNGWHVQYRTALPNSGETTEMLKAIYAGLHAEFSDDVVEFDRSVRNPARLCALYGSVKRKGPNTPDRPHRQSKCWIPSDWRQVHPRQVATLAEFYANRASQTRPNAHPDSQEARTTVSTIQGKGNYSSLDVVGWFRAHGAYVGELTGNVHGVSCPWSGEHSTPSPKSGGDTVIFESDGGWPGFSCKHSHCQGRTIRDVMALWGDADAYCREQFQPRRAA
ncbi:hypothetical protein [Thiocystis violascens]|uniref:Uncharacterized protein n=1 Tax=Thiocystis violascens (strain ATCC 17096 / DSM 198 / 6111) TaxID=765911 RepID=I3YHD5_THIV6|nr:hypothetical protein [Thiocystis violascens]AFL76403.1 hypothetical protein Thivi_4612 [Thiocystis violascens DSM 198]